MTVAKANPEQQAKNPKRRLRAAPTLREQAEQNVSGQVKSSRAKKAGSTIFAPFRLLGKLLFRAGKAIRSSSFGKVIGKIAKSRVLAPVRLLGRLLSKILFLSYFKGSWQELRKVTWPDRRTTWRLTFAVLVFAGVFGAVVAGIDYGFEKLFKEVILKA